MAAPPWVAGESPGSRRGGRRAAHLPRDVLYRRRVLHFIDNTVALSKSVHGYAKDPDMAAVVNSLHTCDAALGVDAWFEWVPSHANISDIPSRDPTTWDEEARAIMAALRARMTAMGICQRDLWLPTAAQLDDPRRPCLPPRAILPTAWRLTGGERLPFSAA